MWFKRKASRKENADTTQAAASAGAATERVIGDLHRAMAGQEFRSAEDVHAFMQKILAGTGGKVPVVAPSSDLERAQELIWEAREEGSKGRRRRLAMKALDVCPDCADAYNVLAELERDEGKAADLYKKAVDAGRRALGEKTFQEDAGHFWGIVEPRPYMRALHGLAEVEWYRGRTAESVGLLLEMLRLNPNDNQGARDLVVPRLIEIGRDPEAVAIMKRCKQEGSTAGVYNRLLLDLRKDGDSARARKQLVKGLRTNPHVVAYLFGVERIPKRLPDSYAPGSPEEAVLYVLSAHGAWKASSGAFEWLAQAASKLCHEA
jgi:tetratricopeptide (TPR) repeat protein